MKILEMLWVRARLAFYRWAMQEIDRLHDDLPKITIKINELERRWAKLEPFQAPLPDLSSGRRLD